MKVIVKISSKNQTREQSILQLGAHGLYSILIPLKKINSKLKCECHGMPPVQGSWIALGHIYSLELCAIFVFHSY